jgi:hypothetical protein
MHYDMHVDACMLRHACKNAHVQHAYLLVYATANMRICWYMLQQTCVSVGISYSKHAYLLVYATASMRICWYMPQQTCVSVGICHSKHAYLLVYATAKCACAACVSVGICCSGSTRACVHTCTHAARVAGPSLPPHPLSFFFFECVIGEETQLP